MPHTLSIPLVGAHFRPPAKQVLAVLPLGTLLRLEPEPDNPYDPDAIRVLVDMGDFPTGKYGLLQAALEGTGFLPGDICMAPEPLHLGYLAASGKPTARGGPGNREALLAISDAYQSQVEKYGEESVDGPDPFTARLGCAPEGHPTVVIEFTP